MSSSGSSSFPSQRPPLQEISDAEKNKSTVRLVPDSPTVEHQGTSSRADQSRGYGSTGAHQHPTDTSSPPTLRRKESFALSSSSSSSSSSPTPSTSWSGPGTRRVSGPRWTSDSAGAGRRAPPTPAMIRGAAAYGSNIRRVNAPTQPPRTANDDGQGSSPVRSRPSSRMERVINVNPDKTFSLTSLRPTRPRISTGSESTSQSYLYSNTSALTSHEETSFDAPSDYHPSSHFRPVPERSVSPSMLKETASPESLSEDRTSSSPWNYRLRGGLRKVPATPVGKGKDIDTSFDKSFDRSFDKSFDRSFTTDSPSLLPELIQRPSAPEPPSSLASKPSFTTEYSDSTLEHAINFRVIGRSSPPVPDSEDIAVSSDSSNGSNYQLIGASSPPQPFDSFSRTREPTVLDTPGSRNYIVHDSPYAASEEPVLDTPGSKNFVVHSNLSSSPTRNPFVRQPRAQNSHDSFSTFGGDVREKYSQESLVIPPLRPHKRSSSEQLYLKQVSGVPHHRRANSFSSISSILTQDSGPNVVRLAHTPSASSLRQPNWPGVGNVGSQKSRMDTHPWSAQLSTVMSEYEGSDQGSRLASLGSLRDRGSSGLGSRGSRQIQSLSSSILETLEQSASLSQSRSRSRSNSLDRPSPIVMRGARDLPTPPRAMVRDHDEHGDGLADLQQHHPLQTKNSRTRLGFLHRQASDRSMRSTTSSGTGVFNFNSIPTWARLYYGSERGWLAPSVISEAGDSRPPSAWVPSGSMTPEEVEQHIRNPRRRPREIHAQEGQHRPTSMEITPVTIGEIRRGPKKRTSSIWSPHLRRDQRSSRYSLWEPPSTTWSVENRIFGRRNIQLVLFTLGFIFPFAWMIAAFLPLPPNPQLDAEKGAGSTSNFNSIPEDSVPEPFYQHVSTVDDSRYQSARWWRTLNRFMSIIGLLILGAVAALIVVGVRMEL